MLLGSFEPALHLLGRCVEVNVLHQQAVSVEVARGIVTRVGRAGGLIMFADLFGGQDASAAVGRSKVGSGTEAFGKVGLRTPQLKLEVAFGELSKIGVVDSMRANLVTGALKLVSLLGRHVGFALA